MLKTLRRKESIKQIREPYPWIGGRMKTAVVTAIGSFSADIVIKNLRKSGVRVAGCDVYPKEWIADSLNVDRFYQVPFATEKIRYVKALLSLCRQEQADFLMVLTDVEVDVLDKNREAFEEIGVILCIPSKKSLRYCRDKRELAQFLIEKNTGNPIATWPLEGADEKKIPYPAVVKPYNGRSSQGLSYVNTQEELKAIKRSGKRQDYIVQPFYAGSIITADVVRQAAAKSCAVICRRELLRTQNGAGTSVFVFRDKRLEALCAKLAGLLEINGCVNFEFIEGEDGAYHLLECNPRFSGGVEFSCMAGYDCVTNHLRCFTGESIDGCGKIKEMYIARKYEEYITKTVEERK